MIRLRIGCALRRAESVQSQRMYAARGSVSIGRLLVRAAEAHARSRGAEMLFLLTGTDNDRAQAFYRAVGYDTYSLALRRSLE